MKRLSLTISIDDQISAVHNVFVRPEQTEDIVQAIIAPVAEFPLVKDGLEAALRTRYVIKSFDEDKKCMEYVASYELATGKRSFNDPIELLWTEEKSKAFKFDNYEMVRMVRHVAACHATIEQITP